MPTTETVRTSTCPDCGKPLAAGICAACALGDLLSESGDVPVGKHEGAQSLDVEFGRYTLRTRLDSGGMGVIYVADDRKLKRRVALKMIRGSTFASEADIARFTVETEAVAALDHPNIIPIYEVGLEDGQPFFTMRLIEGGSLAERLMRAEGRKLPAEEVVALMLPIVHAVQHAHQRGVLHRDLKPANILIGPRGNPWLTDFGLAKMTEADHKLTQTTAQLGTPHYMPPEVVRGETSTVSTTGDVWSLGVMLWELLFGVLPFDGAGPTDIMRRIEGELPSRPRGVRADRDLVTLAMRCLEKNPDRRFGTAGDLAAELERWAKGEPILARPATAGERLVKWVRRKPVWAALVAALGIGVASSSVLWLKAERAVDSLTETNSQLGQALAISTATKLALEARQQVDQDPGRAALLAVAAVDHTERRGMGVLPDAADALFEVLQKVGGRDVSPRGPHRTEQDDGYINLGFDSALPARISPDGRWLVNFDHTDPRRAGGAIYAYLFDLQKPGGGGAVRSWPVWDKHDGAQAMCWLDDSERLVSIDELGRILICKPLDKNEASEPPSQVLGAVGRPGRLPGGVALKADGQGGFVGLAIDIPSSGERALGTAAYRHFSGDGSDKLELGAWRELSSRIGGDAQFTISPDLRWLVSSGNTASGRVHLSKLGDNGQTAALDVPVDNVWHFAFSPRSKWLAVRVGPAEVRVFALAENDAATAAKTNRLLHRHPSTAESFAFSPDEESLAVGGASKLISVIPIEAPEETKALRVSCDKTTVITFSEDGRWIAAGGNKGVVAVWPVSDLGLSPERLDYRGLQSSISDIRIAPDGGSLVAAATHGIYRHWPLDGKSTGSNPVVLGRERDLVTDLAVSPDGRWFALACDSAWRGERGGVVKIVNMERNAEFVLGSHGGSATGVAFSPGGRWLASAGRDGKAKLWDFMAICAALKRGEDLPGAVYNFDMSDTRLEYARRVAFHPLGRLYCTSGDGRMFEWDLNQGHPPSTRQSHRLHSNGYLLPDVQVSPDGRLLALARHGWEPEPVEGSTQIGNMVLLFDVSSPDEIVPIAELPAHFLGDTHVRFSADGRWLAAGAAGNEPTLWDLHAADIEASRIVAPVRGHELGGIAFSTDNQWLAIGGSEGQIFVWDWRSEGRSKTLEAGYWITSLHWLDAHRLASAGRSGRVEIWQTSIERLKQQARQIAGREFSDQERARFRVSGR